MKDVCKGRLAFKIRHIICIPYLSLNLVCVHLTLESLVNFGCSGFIFH